MHNTIGERIKLARNRVGLTQSILAKRLNIAYPTLNKYEKGHRVPNAEILIRIVNELGCNPDWLLTGKGTIETIRSNQLSQFEDFVRVEVFDMAGVREKKDLLKTDPVGTIIIPKKFMKPSIIAVKIRGENMEPTIHGEAVVGVNREDYEIISGKIYAIWLPHEGIVLKRLFMEPDKVILKSDNTLFPTSSVSLKEFGDLLIGRANWVIQEI